MEKQPDNGARVRQQFRELRDRAMDMGKPREIERLAGLIQANSPQIPASLDGLLYNLGKMSLALVVEYEASATNARELAKQFHLTIARDGCGFSHGEDKCPTCQELTERIQGLLFQWMNARPMAIGGNEPTSWSVTFENLLDEEREACAKLLDKARSDEIAMGDDCRKRGANELATAHGERASVLQDVAAAIRTKNEEYQRLRRMAEEALKESVKRDEARLAARKEARITGGGLDGHGVRRDDYVRANLLGEEIVEHFTGQKVDFAARESEYHPLVDHADWLATKLHGLLQEAAKF
jgi:hypothetical protein